MSQGIFRREFAHVMRGARREITARATHGLLGPHIGSVAFQSIYAGKGNRAGAFARGVSRAALGATLSAVGIHRTPQVLGSSRISTGTAGLGVKTSTAPVYKESVAIELPKLSKPISFEKLERVDRPSPNPSYKDGFNQKQKNNYFRNEINFLKGQSAALQRNFEKVDTNLRLVDTKIGETETKFRKSLEQFNKNVNVDQQRAIAEANARSGHDELRRQQVASEPNLVTAPPVIRQERQDPSTNPLMGAIMQSIKRLKDGALLAGGALTGAAATAIGAFLKSKAGQLLRPILSNMKFGPYIGLPAMAVAIMANERKLGDMANDIANAKTELERLQAVNDGTRKSNMVTQKERDTIDPTFDKRIKDAEKAGMPKFEIGKEVVSKLRAKFNNFRTDEERQSAVDEAFTKLKSLGLSDMELNQLKMTLGPAITNFMDGKVARERIKARRERRKSSPVTSGPQGQIGPKGPMMPNKSTVEEALIPKAQEEVYKRPLFKKAKELDFATNLERVETEKQKSQFLKFGQLPTGFEFLPGHMGRLGQPEAVAARGAMPLSSGGGSYSGPATGTTWRSPTEGNSFSNYSAPTGIGPTGSSGPEGPSGPTGKVKIKEDVSVWEGALKPDRKGNVKPTDYYRAALEKLKGSKLIGFVPKDGEKFGIKNGTAEEWARFMTQLTKQESNFNVNVVGDGGESMGLSQMKHGQYGIKDPFDPDQAQSGMIKQFEKYVIRSEHIAGRGKGGVKDGVYGGYRGAAAYFGPLRRQREFFQHNEWMANLRKNELDKIEKVSEVDKNATLTKESARKFTDGEFSRATKMVQQKRKLPPGFYNKNMDTGNSGLMSKDEAYRMYSRDGKKSVSPFNYHQTSEGQRELQGRTQVKLPNGQRLMMNQKMGPRFQGFVDDLAKMGYKFDKGSGNYSYNNRSKRGGGGLSAHAIPNAIDINASRNWWKAGETDMDPKIVEKLASKWGLAWGARFNDAMHFEGMSDEHWNNWLTNAEKKGMVSKEEANFIRKNGRPPTQEELSKLLPKKVKETAIKKPEVVNPALKKQLDKVDELERSAAMAGSDFEPPKSPNTKEPVEIESREVKVAPKETTSPLKKKWLGIPDDLRPSPGVGPTPKPDVKKQINEADRTEMKALSAPPPKKVEPPPEAKETPATPQSEPTKEQSSSGAEKGPSGVVEEETGKSNKSESINPQINPSAGYQPESEPASHGSGGSGSFGRCFV